MEWYCKQQAVATCAFLFRLVSSFVSVVYCNLKEWHCKQYVVLCIIAFCLGYKSNVSSLRILMYVNIKLFCLFVFIYRYGFAG